MKNVVVHAVERKNYKVHCIICALKVLLLAPIAFTNPIEHEACRQTRSLQDQTCYHAFQSEPGSCELFCRVLSH